MTDPGPDKDGCFWGISITTAIAVTAVIVLNLSGTLAVSGFLGRMAAGAFWIATLGFCFAACLIDCYMAVADPRVGRSAAARMFAITFYPPLAAIAYFLLSRGT